MAMTAGWYVENEILIVKSSQSMSIADLMQTSHSVVRMLNTSTAEKVYALGDLTELVQNPINATQISSALNPWLTHPKCGDIVIFGELSPVASFVVDMITKVTSFPFKVVKTEAEAHAYIIARSPALEEAILNAENH